MRLRTSLALVFAALCALQVVAVAPFALRSLGQLLESQHRTRTQEGLAAGKAVLARLDADLLHAMDELAASDEVERVARDAHEVPLPTSVAQAAPGLMAPRALTVLSLLDAQGRTLSSGHLPERLFEKDEPLFAVTQASPTEAHDALVTLATPDGLVTRPARVSARPVDFGERRLWLVGGTLLDDAWATRLSSLVGAKVEVLSQGQRVAQGGQASPPTSRLTLADSPAAAVHLDFSRAGIDATFSEVGRAFGLLFATGLLLAIAFGAVLARRLTRPVESLTQAAQAIAGGALDAQVAEGGSREVRTLIQTFNRMTADLKATTEALLASERIAAWQEVARRLAHEVKNPLTPIRLSLETLRALAERKDERFAATFERASAAMLEEVQRLSRIVDEFSHFARLPRPRLEPLELVALCRSLLELHAPQRVHTALHASGEVRALADKDLLGQVLVNLIKNAVEAMGEAGGSLELTVLTEVDQAVIHLDDTGPGFPPELLPRAFEPYVTTKPQGTGLGLALARRILEEHQGSLEATNRPGTGARLTLRLRRPSGG